MDVYSYWPTIGAQRHTFASGGSRWAGRSSILGDEVAIFAGLWASAIRYYETHGIVPRRRCTAAEYSDYRGDDVEMLRFVHRLRALGLPLEDVRDIVSLRADLQASCAQVRAAMAREAASIEKRIKELSRLRDELAQRRAAANVVSGD